MAVQTLSTPVTPMCTEISLSLFLEKTIETKNITKQQQKKPSSKKNQNRKTTENPEQKTEKAVILSYTKPMAHCTPQACTLAASMGVSYQ